MTYKNALVLLKNKPEKTLLGNAWSRNLNFPGRQYIPDCGCALAEVIPGIVDEINKRAKLYHLSANDHFWNYMLDEEALYNGMTFKEASNLEWANDSYHPGANSLAQCEERYRRVVAWLEEKVQAETEQLEQQTTSVCKEINKKVEQVQ